MCRLDHIKQKVNLKVVEIPNLLHLMKNMFVMMHMINNFSDEIFL